MRRISLSGAISFFLLSITFYTTAAFALPIGWSNTTVNGANVVVDTAGNQWLSPTNTIGQSYSAAMSSVWVTTYGFQSVTQTQFINLLAAYGLPPTTDNNGDGYISNCCNGDLTVPYGGPATTFLNDFGSTMYVLAGTMAQIATIMVILHHLPLLCTAR